MGQRLFGLVACALASGVVAATPEISAIPQNERDTSQFCAFSANDAAGEVVLQMKYWEASMVLDGQLTKLSVKEQNCTSDCVGPGLSGVRVFLLSAPGVMAKLTKQVSCAKDAEVCGGLPEGAAELQVQTIAGEVSVTLWGQYCDM
jgi:hypothetical protein